MSGRIHGEVLDLARRLKAHGLSRNAVDALTVIAEGVRDETRIGSCSRARIADKLFGVERTASRAVAELVKAGLVRVVVAGGGRGRSAVVTVYEVADLHQWLFDRSEESAAQAWVQHRRDITDRQDIQVSPGSDQPDPSAGHPDVPPNVPPIRPESDRRDISGPSAGHLGVSPPVLPVEALGGPVLDAPTRPRERNEPPPVPPAVERPPAPRCPRHCDTAPGSWVPENCRDCAVLGRAHRARHTDLARAEARARRACTECNRYGLMLGPDGELLDLRCAHPTVPDEIWAGHDLTAPPKPPPVEASPARHRQPAAGRDDRQAPGWRPSPYPRTRPLERTPT